ncbi:hypothetical protein [Streptosporangium sp. NPDC000396]|uniref:hypothetical protein n=1 Tax=Streptosporangium sp. NPDC000396 TaxID=3366185 RepID=UPI0036CAE425
MEPRERLAVRRRKPGAFDLVIMIGGLLLVVLAVQNAGPALAALRGDGIRGVFTAQRVECIQHPGHEQCSWLGEFRSAAGIRPGIAFYGSDREMFAPGQTSPAFDTGRRGHVYGPGGSNEWIVVALLFLAGLGLIARPWLRRPRVADPGGAVDETRVAKVRPSS